MKYISIDIETSGLDPETNQILSIAAVIEDTNNIKPLNELPHIHIGILRESITGSIFALNLNKDLIETINDYQTATDIDEQNYISYKNDMIFVQEQDAVLKLFQFLYTNGIEYDKKGLVYSKDSMIPMLSSNMKKMYLNIAGKNFATFDKLFLEKIPRWKQAFKIRSRILDPGILFIDWQNDESAPSLDQCKVRAGLSGKVSHNAYEDALDVIAVLRKSYEKI